MRARSKVDARAKSKAEPLRLPNAPFDRVLQKYKTTSPTGRPTTIKSVPGPKDAPPDAFGLQIDGDCLAPRARHGQVVIVERAMPKPGDLAVLWFKGGRGPVVKILCNEIVGYPLHPESECVPLFNVEQLNPPKRYECRLDKIECIARVHTVVAHPRLVDREPEGNA